VAPVGDFRFGILEVVVDRGVRPSKTSDFVLVPHKVFEQANQLDLAFGDACHGLGALPPLQVLEENVAQVLSLRLSQDGGDLGEEDRSALSENGKVQFVGDLTELYKDTCSLGSNHVESARSFVLAHVVARVLEQLVDLDPGLLDVLSDFKHMVLVVLAAFSQEAQPSFKF